MKYKLFRTCGLGKWPCDTSLVSNSVLDFTWTFPPRVQHFLHCQAHGILASLDSMMSTSSGARFAHTISQLGGKGLKGQLLPFPMPTCISQIFILVHVILAILVIPKVFLSIFHVFKQIYTFWSQLYSYLDFSWTHSCILFISVIYLDDLSSQAIV